MSVKMKYEKYNEMRPFKWTVKLKNNALKPEFLLKVDDGVTRNCVYRT